MVYPTKRDLLERFGDDEERIDRILANIERLRAEGWKHSDLWPMTAPDLKPWIADHIYTLRRPGDTVLVAEPYPLTHIDRVMHLRQATVQGFSYELKSSDYGLHYPSVCQVVWFRRVKSRQAVRV